MGIRHPHEVPACTTNSGVQFRYKNPYHRCPVFAERFTAQIEAIWQNTFFTKKYCVQLHSCRLRGAVGTLGTPECGAIGIEAIGALEEECPVASSAIGAGVLFAAAAAFIRELNWVNGPDRPSRIALRSAKCFSTSIFLMRLMAAPVLLCCLLERCSSGAKPGELKARRGIPDCSLKHTPQTTCVPESVLNTRLSNSTENQKHNHDQQDDPQSSGRIIAPASAVRPPRQRAQ